MAVNMYDLPALALFINTYAPINFGELYRIGAAQKQSVDEAAQLFTSSLLKFGEFQSPSQIDTQNYYNLTIGRKEVQDAINQAVSNPDAMKDAGFRSNLLSIFNSIDYAGLSKLKQSSESLNTRAKMIAQMKAQGKYNENWDDIDINNWDTSAKGIMNELSPIEYMNANQLSNPYFDNLAKGTLGSQWKDGVKYTVTGNNMEDLYAVANARYNDLINTPQGQQYYNLFLKGTNGDEEKAKSQFVDMIANSQIDRTRRPTLDVDKAWLSQIKNDKPGTTEIVKPYPTRLDFLNDTVYKSVNKGIADNLLTNFRNYVAGLVDKYPGTKIAEDAAKGVKNIDAKLDNIDKYSNISRLYELAYRLTGNDEYLIRAAGSANIAEMEWKDLMKLGRKHVLRGEFERVAGFSPFAKNKDDSEMYNSSRYIDGVGAALNLIKGKIGVTLADPLLTSTGGKVVEIANEDGTKEKTVKYPTTEGFLMPETVFRLMANDRRSDGRGQTPPRDIKRPAGIFRSDKFPVRELIESGKLKGVQFFPDSGVIKIGDTFTLSGKMRISKKEIESAVGTGTWSSAAATLAFPFGRGTTKAALKELFGATKVEEVVGDDGITYYELETYKTVPSDKVSPELWQRINQEWQSGGEGIGGTSQAGKTYMDSAEQNLN